MPESQDSCRFPVRKNPRLPHYDYRTPNAYFITICTKDKLCFFGKPNALTPFGKIAAEGIENIPAHFPGARADKYVVMPNHVHMILILENPAVSVSTVIGLYKSYVSKVIHEQAPEITVWQASFHDHIIRNQHSYEQIWQYIDTNPLQWDTDCFCVP